MAGEPGGIAASVRRQLAEGRSRDEIVAGLVSGGLSKLSAERFVDREIGAQPPPLPPLEPLIPASAAPPPIEEPVERVEPVEPFEPAGTMYEGPPVGGPDQLDQFLSTAKVETAEPDARRDLRLGSYVTTIGIALTVISTLFSRGGVLFYGAVLYGIFLFIRGVIRYARLDRPFPWGRVIALAAIPIVSTPVLFFAVASFALQRDMAASRALEEADVESARAVRRKAGDAYERRQRRSADNVDTIVDKLNTPGWQCDAATQLAKSQSDLAVEPLVRYLQRNPGSPYQVCLVKALVDLGEISTALGYYRAWVQGDNIDLYRAGVRGFGEIGPDAAGEALPLLKYLVESQNVGDRVLAVQTLAKLGPDAEDMLTILEQDIEYTVRYQAQKALADLEKEK
jgi:hypothetical protein